jgi:hypothetical protein
MYSALFPFIRPAEPPDSDFGTRLSSNPSSARTRVRGAKLASTTPAGSIRRRWVTIGALVLLGILPVAGVASGILIGGAGANGESHIDFVRQRALIHWTNGVERLVLETQFRAGATNLAWVIPLPAKAVLEEGTAGLFPTLEFLFRPEIVHRSPPLYAFFTALFGLAYGIFAVKRYTWVTFTDLLVCGIVALAIATTLPLTWLPVPLLFVYGLVRIRDGVWRPFEILIVVPVAMILGLIFPYFPASQRGAVPMGVHDSPSPRLPTDFKVRVLDSDLAGIEAWSRESGIRDTIESATFSEYARRGWKFVAVTFNHEATTAIGATPTLSFTFPSPAPVFPGPSTGIRDGPMHADLYVFGPGQAVLEGFAAERCARTVQGEADPAQRRWMHGIRIVHPTLRHFADHAPIATRLSGMLARGDPEIRWTDYEEQSTRRYSHRGALLQALTWGCGVMAGAMLIGGFVSALEVSGCTYVEKLALVAVGLGLFVFAGTYVALPKTEVQMIRAPGSHMSSTHNFLSRQILGTNSPASLIQTRLNWDRVRREFRQSSILTNRFTGGLIREEDSPGNYILRQGTNGIEYLWFDADGGEHRL